jgi:hypothetical protein
MSPAALSELELLAGRLGMWIHPHPAMAPMMVNIARPIGLSVDEAHAEMLPNHSCK